MLDFCVFVYFFAKYSISICFLCHRMFWLGKTNIISLWLCNKSSCEDQKDLKSRQQFVSLLLGVNSTDCCVVLWSWETDADRFTTSLLESEAVLKHQRRLLTWKVPPQENKHLAACDPFINQDSLTMDARFISWANNFFLGTGHKTGQQVRAPPDAWSPHKPTFTSFLMFFCWDWAHLGVDHIWLIPFRGEKIKNTY